MKVITQTQISQYEVCKYSYYLRYVKNLVWPIEPSVSQNIRKGDDFHLLVRQLILGFPPDSLIIPGKKADLWRWLEVYCARKPLGKPDMVFAEKEVSVLYADVLWLGKFDALTVNDDQLIIYDWKTGSAIPDQKKYRESPQTKLYRFLARTCASRLIGAGMHAIPAENIEMVYWFPEYPDKTVHLPYSEEEYQQDMTWSKTRAREMTSEAESDYPRTANTHHCRYCDYRTFCFTSSAPVFMDEDIPETPEPDDICQEGLFSPEFFADNEQEVVNF